MVSWPIPKGFKKVFYHRHSLPAATAAMYSDSAADKAVSFCFFEYQEIAEPFKVIKYPDVEQ
jgi:hypothetical protein